MINSNLRKIFFLGCMTLSVMTTRAQQSAHLSDEEIASIAVTANQVDIDVAQTALSHSKNTEVINFAKTMINDHKAVIGQAVALATRLKVVPKKNTLTQKLLDDAEKTKNALKKLKSSAFDKAYISNEVAYHKAVISVVETVLVPQANNAELKSLLQSVVPALKTHLAHAEMVQANMKK